MKKVYFNGTLECGAFIQNAMVEVSDDYTMIELVKAIKKAGYVNFMVDGMKKLEKVY